MDPFFNNEQFKAISSKKDEVIKNALISNGFNPANHQFISDNFSLIHKEGDRYEHLYYHFGKDDVKRIISIEKNPEWVHSNDGNTFKVNTTYHYY